GLKPVQRRVLYTMYDLANDWNRPYKKSARVVGEVMGRYHPHGDAAIYDAIARMAQDFSLRYPLIDGQGNFGSIDGDPPAAMRYTEVRMARIASDLLADIDKDTVDFQPNYDEPTTEPALREGRGILTVRARVAIETNEKTERQAIIVTEIPFQVNKARLIEQIAELVNQKTIDGISDLRDESDRDGMRIVIELKREAIAEIVLNQLYRHTPMQD